MGHRHHYISPAPIREAMGAGLMEVMAGKVGGFEREYEPGQLPGRTPAVPCPLWAYRSARRDRRMSDDESRTEMLYRNELSLLPAVGGELVVAASRAVVQPVNGRPFPKGQSGNPNGRAKGSRNKISELFVMMMRDDFALHGAAAIASVRERDPAAYLGMVRGMVPRELLLANDAKPDAIDFAGMDDGEFADALDGEGGAQSQAFVHARRMQAVEMAAAGKAGSVREAMRMLGADV